jgi:hypothetical protein
MALATAALFDGVWSKKSAEQQLMATMGLETRLRIPIFPATPAGRCGGIGIPDTNTREHHAFRATAMAATAVHRCWVDQRRAVEDHRVPANGHPGASRKDGQKSNLAQ